MRVYLFIFIFSCFMISCENQDLRGSKSNPFIFSLTPSENSEDIIIGAKKIAAFLEKSVSQILYGKDSGFYVKAVLPISYLAVMESFTSGRVDFSPLSTFNYLMIMDDPIYPVQVILSGRRSKKSVPFYFSQIIVRSDSSLNTFSDLKGKRFAFSDPASSSGHLAPQAFLLKNKIEIGEKIFAGRHDSVVTMVYQGKADAGATYHIPGVDGEKSRDARDKVKLSFPDVFEKVKILGLTPPIPNSPWLMRSNIYKDKVFQNRVKKALQESLQKFINTKNGKELFLSLDSISVFDKITTEVYKERLKGFRSKEMLKLIKSL